MKAFICHYTQLADRRRYLEQALPAAGFADAEWVTEHDIRHYDLDAVYDPSPGALARRNATAFGRFGITRQAPLRRGVVEVTLQHFEAYRRLLAQGMPAAVILEDDVVFGRSFARRFDLFLGELPPRWDVFYFGRGRGGHRAPMTLGERLSNLLGRQHVFRNEERRSRFSDSYAITARAAELVLGRCFPFHLPIDWELNFLQASLELEVFWSEPALTHQGSSSGRYRSSLRASG